MPDFPADQVRCFVQTGERENATTLQEYQPVFNDARDKVTCYIESKNNVQFAVFIQSGLTALLCKIWADGIKRQGAVMSEFRIKRSEILSSQRFGSQTTKASHALPINENIIKSLGTIRVEVWRMQVGRTVPNRRGPRHQHYSDFAGNTYNEKSKKAQLTSSCELGARSYLPTRPSTRRQLYDEIDPRDGPPFRTFEYIYRPSEWLEDKDIKPSAARPVSPVRRSPAIKEDHMQTPSNKKRKVIEIKDDSSSPHRKFKKEKTEDLPILIPDSDSD